MASTSRRRINGMHFAGSWYPDSPERLEAALKTAVTQIDGTPDGTVAAIVPHAALRYSAHGMAAAFARVSSETIDQIVILAPSHSERLKPDTLHGFPFQEHETPLGSIPGMTDLPEHSECRPEQIEQEHAVELLLPCVRYMLPGRDVAALLIPPLSSLESATRLSTKLTEWLGNGIERTLMLASSDFTHYGSRFGYTPYGTDDRKRVHQEVLRDDSTFAEAAATGAVKQVWNRITGGPISICGRYSILVLTALLAQRSYVGSLVSYYTSDESAARRHTVTDFVAYATVTARPEPLDAQ